MYGNGGDDILIGGAGKDELWGGAGLDTFVFRFPDATSTDRVKDFSGTEHDRIGIYASDYGLSVGHGLVNDGTGKLVLDPSYFAAVAGSASFVQGTSSGHGQFVFSSTRLDPDTDVGCRRRGPLAWRRARHFKLGRRLERRRLLRFQYVSDRDRERLSGSGARARGRSRRLHDRPGCPVERGRAIDLLDDGWHGRGRQRLCRRFAWPCNDRRWQHQRHRLDRCACR